MATVIESQQVSAFRSDGYITPISSRHNLPGLKQSQKPFAIKDRARVINAPASAELRRDGVFFCNAENAAFNGDRDLTAPHFLSS
jgi:hypothetical protein